MFPQKRYRTHSKSNFGLETGDSTCLYPLRHSGILPSGLHVYGAHTTATVGGSAVWLWFPFSLLWTVFLLINLMLLNRCAIFISHLRLALEEVYSCLCSCCADSVSWKGHLLIAAKPLVLQAIAMVGALKCVPHRLRGWGLNVNCCRCGGMTGNVLDLQKNWVCGWICCFWWQNLFSEQQQRAFKDKETI